MSAPLVGIPRRLQTAADRTADRTADGCKWNFLYKHPPPVCTNTPPPVCLEDRAYYPGHFRPLLGPLFLIDLGMVPQAFWDMGHGPGRSGWPGEGARYPGSNFWSWFIRNQREKLNKLGFFLSIYDLGSPLAPYPAARPPYLSGVGLITFEGKVG